MSDPEHHTSTSRLSVRQLIAGGIGNTMEWYDFAVYGYLATVIGAQFFPTADGVSGVLAAFGVFAVGFLMRPIGAIVFGHLGDRIGRKHALILSVISMALPTVALGLLPTYAQIGLLAPILLTFIRLVQGLSVGGEYTGSITYLVESSDRNGRGLKGSLSATGSMAGFLLGSAISAVLSMVFTEQQLHDWAWRLPFLFGGVIGVVALFMRKGLPETESFAAVQADEEADELPIRHALRYQWRPMLQVLGYVWASAVSVYMVFLYLPTFLQTYGHMHAHQALWINTAALVVITLLIPLFGWLSDRIGRKRIAFMALIAIVVGSWPMFLLFEQPTVLTVLGAQLAFAVIVAAQQGINPAFLAEQFQHPQSRLTAFSLSFSLAYALFGGTTPALAALLVHLTGNHEAGAIYLTLAAVISLLTLITMREHAGKAMA